MGRRRHSLGLDKVDWHVIHDRWNEVANDFPGWKKDKTIEETVQQVEDHVRRCCEQANCMDILKWITITPTETPEKFDVHVKYDGPI